MAYYTDATADNIQKQLLNNVDDSYEKSIGYPMYDTLKSFAIALADMYTELSNVRMGMENVDNLTGVDLERFVEQRTGLVRKLGSIASTVLTVTGNGTIKAGDKFETKAGIQFACTQDTTITNTGTIPVQAMEVGTYANVPANTIVQIPVTIAGIVSVTNLNVVIDGMSDENDDSLRQRYYIYLRNPVTSNNENAFINWAESITGVGRAKCFGTWQGKNTILVVICNANMQVANNNLIQSVQEQIDPKGVQDEQGNWSTWGLGKGLAGMGSYCTVQSATPKNIDITVDITMETNYTTDNIKTAFTKAIEEYFKEIALPDKNTDSYYVSYAKIGNVLFETDGISDYSNLQINGDTANIELSLTSILCEIPTLGSVTLNVK